MIIHASSCKNISTKALLDHNIYDHIPSSRHFGKIELDNLHNFTTFSIPTVVLSIFAEVVVK